MAIGAAMALVLLGSACAKKTITPGAGGATTPQSTAGTGTGGGYGGYGGYGGRGGTSSTPSTVATGTAVQQGAGGALVFSPTSLSVKQGVTIMVSNVGTTQHTFTITGKGIDVVNNPGQTQSVAINLAPGTYQFICRFHVGFGMKGTLTVTA